MRDGAGGVVAGPVDMAQGTLIDDELRLIHWPGTDALPGIVSAIRATGVKYPDRLFAPCVGHARGSDQDEGEVRRAGSEKAEGWGKGWKSCTRVMTAARAVSPMLRQWTISSMVRPQPVQVARAASSWHRLRQGLAGGVFIT